MKKHLVLSLIVCLSALIIGTTMAESPNGRAGVTPAYYDATLFTINLKSFPPDVAANLIAHNKSINTIYRSEGTIVPGQGPWIDVLDAIQGDGFNPLWQEVTVTFKPGVTPFQLFSDDQVTAAAAAPDAKIPLTTTNEVYRCSVIGPGKPKK
jgi:hypothetical protein